MSCLKDFTVVIILQTFGKKLQNPEANESKLDCRSDMTVHVCDPWSDVTVHVCDPRSDATVHFEFTKVLFLHLI